MIGPVAEKNPRCKRHSSTRRLRAFAVSALLLLPLASWAENSLATSATASGPDATTATYGDWTLQCRRGPEDAPARGCELLQTLLADGQRPLVRLAIGRLSSREPLKLAAMLPAHLSFAEPPRVSIGETPAGALTLAWRRCLPAGCFADADLPDKLIKQWRTTEQSGRLAFQDGAGRPVSLPVSFRGVGEALDALTRK